MTGDWHVCEVWFVLRVMISATGCVIRAELRYKG